MCISPIALDDGRIIRCRKCRTCRGQQVKDWIGRCRAEMATSRETLFATLTYGQDDKYSSSEDNLKAKMLHFSDTTNWLKTLRHWTLKNDQGFDFEPRETKAKLRYFLVGEYGTTKGRAHFHVILFVGGRRPPNIIISDPKPATQHRYMHKHQRGGYIWPHGWSHWMMADIGSIRYAVMYILKHKLEEGEKRVGFSSMPGLGSEYFELEAQRYVDQGLSPKDATYSFAGDRDHKGRPYVYRLWDVSLFNFCSAFALRWQEKYDNERWPRSDLMEWFEEERYRREQYGQVEWRQTPEWLNAKDEERKGIWPSESVVAKMIEHDRQA